MDDTSTQSLEIPRTTLMIGVARHFIRDLVPAPIRDDALLIVSELATNAVRYGDGANMTITLHLGDHAATIAVTDGGNGDITVPRSPAAADAENGHGLWVVLSVAGNIHQDKNHSHHTISAILTWKDDDEQ